MLALMTLGLLALLAFGITTGLKTNENLAEHVQVGASCNVVSKHTRHPAKQSRKYYVQTSDCGKLKVGRNDYSNIDDNGQYFVDIHGDETVQQVGENWRKR